MKIKHIIITVALIFSLVALVHGKPLTLDEVLEGACRVSTSNTMGSGTCIKYQDNQYLFLTNGHVVNRNKNVYIELFRGGHKTYKIPASVLQVFWTDNTDKDFAILAVHEKYVSKYPPRVIPLIPLGYDISLGSMRSAGCPEGRWLNAWEGQVEDKQSTRIVFSPPPVGGQSGSGLLVNVDINGELYTRVGAVITFRISTDGSGIFNDRRDKDGFEIAKGAAIPISTLYKILGYEKNTYTPTKFPPYYITTGKTFLYPYPTKDPQHYARGDDNKYYCVYVENHVLYCENKPSHVKVIRWPVVPMQIPPCTGPNCPNCLDGNNPNNRLILPNKPRVNPLIPRIGNIPPVQPNNGDPYGGKLPDIRPDDPIPANPLENSLENPPEKLPLEEVKPSPIAPASPVVPLPISDEELQIVDLKEKISQLRDQLDTSHDNYQVLLDEKKALEASLNLKEKVLTEKEQTLESKEAEENRLTGEIDTLSANLTTTEQAKQDAEQAKQDAETAKMELEGQVGQLSEVVSTNEETVDGLKTQRTWLGFLGGGLGMGLLSTFGWMFWNRLGREKAKTFVDNTQDSIDDRIDDIIGEAATERIHDWVDSLQDMASEAIDNAIQSKLPNIIGNRVEKKTTEDEILAQTYQPTYKTTEKIDVPVAAIDEIVPEDSKNSKNPEIYENYVDKSASPEYNSGRRQRVGRRERRKKNNPVISEPVNFTITNNNTNNADSFENYKINDTYLKEFCNHKVKDGERLEDWALRSLLYKEALEELRKGKLYYKGKSKLQGQQETARQITEWVRNEFLKRLTRRDILNQDELRREAMLGFLYQEAVDKLAQGYFSVLGYQNTATAINNWVNKEFLRRINIII